MFNFAFDTKDKVFFNICQCKIFTCQKKKKSVQTTVIFSYWGKGKQRSLH